MQAMVAAYLDIKTAPASPASGAMPEQQDFSALLSIGQPIEGPIAL